ncbi:MAG: hypothetical protein NT075_37610 [Chloroflexi bacterium]|nr:hypothetical protein [Chloroflexota bacterium]
MPQWTVRDRDGNEIYVTEERWSYIVERHDELTDRLPDLLDTVRYGDRKQDALEPQKYRYRRAYTNLMYGYNHIVAVVVFHYNDMGIPNNFVVTAWGAYIYPKG